MAHVGTAFFNPGPRRLGKRKFRVTTQAHLSPLQRQQVKRLVDSGAETYQYDNSISPASVSTAATIQTGFSTPTQGVGDGQRTGDMIELKRFMLNYNIICADATNVVRVILFRWYENNSSNAPTAAQVLQASTNFNSMINHDSIRERKLHVFYDKTHRMTLVGTADVGANVSIGAKALGRKNIAFDNAAITGEGLIYGLFISDSSGVSHPTIDWYCRLEYKDA